MTTSQIRKLKEEYDEKYFEGKLKDFVVIVKDRRTKRLNGRCYIGLKKIELFRHAINARGSEIAWKEVLIHEMTHGYVRGGHNARFHAVQSDVFAREFGITNYKRSRFVHHIENEIKDPSENKPAVDLTKLSKVGDKVKTPVGEGILEKIQSFVNVPDVYYFVKMRSGNTMKIKAT